MKEIGDTGLVVLVRAPTLTLARLKLIQHGRHYINMHHHRSAEGKAILLCVPSFLFPPIERCAPCVRKVSTRKYLRSQPLQNNINTSRYCHIILQRAPVRYIQVRQRAGKVPEKAGEKTAKRVIRKSKRANAHEMRCFDEPLHVSGSLRRVPWNLTR